MVPPLLFDRLVLKYLQEREGERQTREKKGGGNEEKKVKRGTEEGKKRRKERANDRTGKERDPSFLLSFLPFH